MIVEFPIYILIRCLKVSLDDYYEQSSGGRISGVRVCSLCEQLVTASLSDSGVCRQAGGICLRVFILPVPDSLYLRSKCHWIEGLGNHLQGAQFEIAFNLV